LPPGSAQQERETCRTPRELIRRMNERAYPFIGHEGVGSRISVEKKNDRLILKESPFSQLIVVFGLLLFGPGLTVLMIAKRRDAEFLRTPWPILLTLALFSLIGWIAERNTSFVWWQVVELKSAAIKESCLCTLGAADRRGKFLVRTSIGSTSSAPGITRIQIGSRILRFDSSAAMAALLNSVLPIPKATSSP
jgi:hypothetical protein